jgi:hypothetical protein
MPKKNIQIQITKWISRQAKDNNTNIEIRITYSVCSQKQLYYLTVLDYSDNMPPILVILGFRWTINLSGFINSVFIYIRISSCSLKIM